MWNPYRKLCRTLFGFDPADPPEVREYDRAWSKFYNDARRDNLTYEEMSQELRLRTALAQIQRIASLVLFEDPRDPLRAIRDATEEACRSLSREDEKVLRATVAKTTMRNMITPDVYKLVERAMDEEHRHANRRQWLTGNQMAGLEYRVKGVLRPTDDQRAGLRMR